MFTIIAYWLQTIAIQKPSNDVYRYRYVHTSVEGGKAKHLKFKTMKKVNLLSKAELKKVLGGGLPPETPGGDPSICQPRGYIVCIDNGGSGDAHSYFYACCDTMAQAQAFCPAGSAYGCQNNFIID